jgi:excisionase family DNA binding protein
MTTPIRLSVSEAARLFGISEKTIRRAIQNKDINYIVVAGRYKLNFESLVKWSQKKTHVRNKSEKYGIDQYVDKWKLSSTLYSPNPPTTDDAD